MDEINVGKIAGWLIGVAVFLFILVGVFQFFYQVNAGERGVLLTFGKPSMEPIGEGLHTKIPYVQSVAIMDIKTQKYEADLTAASKDLQDVVTKIAINYHLISESVPKLYQEIGVDYATKVIYPLEQEANKAATAQFTAEELILKRDAVRAMMLNTIRDKLLPRGIMVEDVSIINFKFSQTFSEAIERKVVILQESLASENKLKQIQFEAQQTIAKAEGDMNSTIAIAYGNAQATKLNGEAQAYAIDVINRQLAQSPQYIEYLKANKWNGNVPTYMMSGATIPMISLPGTGFNTIN